MFRRLLSVSLVVATWCVMAGFVRADLHTWQINEIFSDSTGTYQFIELQERAGSNNQQRLSSSIAFSNHTLDTATSTPFTFTSDLPSTLTANKFFLVATSGFSSLPGAVTPDYIMPNNFFSISGDTITFAGTVDSFAYTGAQIPSDGVNSLLDTYATGVNSPRNFAGQQGSVTIPPVPEPSTFCMVAIGSIALLFQVARRRRQSR